MFLNPKTWSDPRHWTIMPAGSVQLCCQVSQNSTPQCYAKTAHSGSFQQITGLYNEHDMLNK